MNDKFAKYTAALQAGVSLAPLQVAMIAAMWFWLPFNMRMIVNPSQMIRFEHWLGGEAQPVYFSQGMLVAGEMKAVLALVMASVVLLVGLTLFYRRTRFALNLWPVALIGLGLIGNAMWGVGRGWFDFVGLVLGLTPMAATVFGQMALEKMGMDFVFGPGNRPEFEA
jgi:hypothetical protein